MEAWWKRNSEQYGRMYMKNVQINEALSKNKQTNEINILKQPFKEKSF